MILREYQPLLLSSVQLSEAANNVPGSPMIIRKVLLQKANAKNRNGRIYPKEILEREMNKYEESFVNHNRALGELDHSNENVVNLKNVSHNIKKIWWEGDGVYGDVEIFDSPEFPAGRIAAGLLRRKIPVGISSRGLGSVEQVDESTSMVNDDFALLTFDLVSYESTIGSNFSLNEGYKNVKVKNYDSLDKIMLDIICSNSGVCSCMFDKK
jgi:hypothetical protein